MRPSSSLSKRHQSLTRGEPPTGDRRMTEPSTHPSPCTGTRREFLWEAGAGFAGLALTALLEQDGFFARHAGAQTRTANPLAPRPSHFAPKAKSVIFLFMYGGPPSMDTFDYRPELQRRDGQTVNLEMRRRSIQQQRLLASRRTFRRCGQSGLWCSDAFPHLARQMDKLCV